MDSDYCILGAKKFSEATRDGTEQIYCPCYCLPPVTSGVL